ncbi:hypothetical protein MUP59_07490 [Candidatus Bathyarchaeota archaeon]|nr:hypothetical protein [Candidatus Bathyarchaeota archaeon]
MDGIDLRALEAKMNKTGFPLELRCTRMLEKAEWGATNNFIFEDPEQQKHRELDILASDAPAIFDELRCMSIYVFIECKKSAHPWIFYPSSGNIGRVILALHDQIFRDGENKRGSDETDILVSHLKQKSHFCDSKIFSWFYETEEGKHEIYDAISKIAKATYYVTVGEREELEPMHPPLLFVVYQTIVLDGLLCGASLQSNRFHLSPKKHVVLGTDFACPVFRTHMLIDVVQSEYFSKYIRILDEERNEFVRTANDFFKSSHQKVGVN